MNCHTFHNRISAYLDHELTGQQMIAMREHLSHCDACRDELEAIRKVSTLFVETTSMDAPEGLEDRILQAVHASAQQKPKRAASLMIATASAAAACFVAYIVSSVFTPMQETQPHQMTASGFDLSADQAYQISSDPFSSHVPVAIPAGHSQP